MLSRYLAILVCLATLLAGTAASAVTWPQIGPACTPDRAVPWDSSRSEISQAACHCPPPSFCPTSYGEYVDASRYRMPPSFVSRCCPVIPPPICPSGTVSAGQVWPDINDEQSCNRCPLSDHTDQNASHLGSLSPVVENCWDHCPSNSYYPGMRLEQVPNRNCNPPICPPNTQGAGGLAPNGDINQCAPLCTYGSLIGQVRPADNECDPQFCPPGTQHAGARMYPHTDCGYYCPGGTYYQGSLVNSVPNGNCNPAICPPGTIGEGQPAPGNDAGNCPRPAPSCPSKYYPTLSESQLYNVNPEYRGTFTYQNGSRYSFAPLRNGNTMQDGQAYGSGLTARYNFSLRTGNFNGSLGGGRGAYGWTWVGSPGWGCTSGDCPFPRFYSPSTDGFNNGDPFARDIIGHFGPDQLTWFAFSVAKISYLADNRMDEGMLNAWAGRDRAQIGTADSGDAYSEEGTGAFTYTPHYLEFPIENGASGFMRQCRDAAGQYVELEWKNINGQQCAYLQCRYVYEGTTAVSCLTGDTGITLADGTVKKVSELKLGDVVKGSDGDHKITASNIYQSALRVMYGVNGSGQMLTGDHPIRTTEGWKVITDEAAKLYADKPGFATATKLAVGDTLITAKGEVKVTEIKRFANVEPISTYNIRVEGNNGFYANGIEVRGFDKMEMHY